MALRWHPMMFYNELDWLECQLTETYDAMHRYIVVEATRDHQGHEKPLFFDQNQDRFAPWRDKIIHVVVEDLPSAEQAANHWERERPQRDRAMRVLAEQARPEDLIFNLDVDEIPSRSALVAETPEIKGLQLSNHLFAVDWYAEMNVMGTLVPMNCLDTSWRSSELPGAVLGGLSWIREHRYGYPYIPNAGWHFSWVGGVEEYIAKDQRTPHVEHHAARMAPGAPEESYCRGAGQTPVEVGPDWPRYIRERRCPASWFRPR
jgi:hypothetical protein